MAIWAFAYTFIYSNNDQKNIWIWYKISSIGWCLFPSVSLHLMLIVSKKINKFSNSMLILLLYLPAVIFFAEVLSGNMIAIGFIKKSFGNMEVLNTGSIWYWLYIFYYSLFPLIGFNFIAGWGIKTKFKIEKKQSAVILLSGCIVLILGSVFNIILPSMKIYAIPSIAPIICIIWLAFMAHAILNYKILNLNPVITMDEIISNILDVIIIVDSDNKIIKVNHKLEQVLNYKEKELIGKPIDFLISKNQIDLIEYQNIQQNVTSKMGWEIFCYDKKGEIIPFSFYKAPIKNRYEDMIGIIFIGRDLRLIKRLENEINDRQLAEMELKKARDNLEAKVIERTKELELYATTDTMTGIYNRRIGLLMLEKEIHRSKRDKTNLAVCFIDIDDLKYINDTYGHMEGDSLIMTVADILKKSLRRSDIICRMGGDEFLLILPRCSKSQGLLIRNTIEKKIKIKNEQRQKKYKISISYGFSEFDYLNPLSLDELISIADLEMYQYKKDSKKKQIDKI